MPTTSDLTASCATTVGGPHSRFVAPGVLPTGAAVEGQAGDLVRALSHDMTAYFMLLDHSLQRLKESAIPHQAHAAGAPPAPHTAGKFAPLPSPERAPQIEAPSGDLAERFAHVEACLRESRRFLDDLVMLARTGGIEMAPCRVEMSRMVQEVLYEQRELLEARGIQVTIDPAMPAVWCNPARVKQVLTNLIRNAAKHGSSASRPRIVVARRSGVEPAAAPQATKPALEWFAVEDNGPGIPAEAREDVFLPGRRLPTAHPDGTGMGLSIVRRIVEYYGGQVLVDPQIHDGAAIVFSLPTMP